MVAQKRKKQKNINIHDEISQDTYKNEFIPQGTLGGRSIHQILKGTDNKPEQPVVEGTIIVSEDVIKKE